MRDKKLNFLIQAAIFASITAILAQLSVPMPSGVPITLQTFAIALCGFFLGPFKSLLSVVLYLIMGAIGLPVFSNLHGGMGYLLGATGGFLFGFLPMALLCGVGGLFQIEKIRKASGILKITAALLLATIGLATCHLAGALHFANFTKKEFTEVLPLVSYPFLIKDTLSIVSAYFLSLSIRNRILPSARTGNKENIDTDRIKTL